MKLVSKLALGVALALGVSGLALVSPAVAQKNKKEEAAKQPEAYQPKLGAKFRKPYGEAAKALGAKDYAAAAAALPAMDEAASTPDEKYATAQVRLMIGSNTKDEAMQKRAVNDFVAANVGPADDLAKMNFYKGNFAYKDKDYPTAITALTAAEAGGFKEADVYLLLAESYFNSKQVPQGLAQVERAIASEKAAGKTPPQDWYSRAASVSYREKSQPDAMKWTRMLVEAYPTAENWRSALVVYRDGSNLDNATTLDLFRLMRLTKSLGSERDYYEYALNASERGLPGEAKAVVDEGRALAVFDGTNRALADVLSAATARIAGDKASLVGADKQAAAAKDGKVAMGTADAYLGYGEDAKAVEMYRLAIEKGGVDANVANTRLGIALARSGQADAARTAFQAVTGPRAELAQFWMLWLNQRG